MVESLGAPVIEPHGKSIEKYHTKEQSTSAVISEVI